MIFQHQLTTERSTMVHEFRPIFGAFLDHVLELEKCLWTVSEKAVEECFQVGVELLYGAKHLLKQSFAFGPFGGLPFCGIECQLRKCRHPNFTFDSWSDHKRPNRQTEFAQSDGSPFARHCIIYATA